MLRTWENFPELCYNHQYQLFNLLRFWLLSLTEIPINYLIQKYLKLGWKKQKRGFYLKYQYIKKNILSKLKKKVILTYFKNHKQTRSYNSYTKFWRPRHVLSVQLGELSFKWFETGLQIHVPLFFWGSKRRVLGRKNATFPPFLLKKKSNFFIKKSKLQVFKLYFIKLILERQLQKLLNFSVLLNFRNLLFLSKALLRLRTNQAVVYQDNFFFQKDPLFKKSVYIFALGFYFCQSKIIAQQLAIRITRSRKHWRTLKQLKKTLHYLRLLSPEVNGYQVDIYGKIGAKTRTKCFRMKSGKLPNVQALGTKIQYTYHECFSFTGVFGIHVWLCTEL